MKPARWRSSDRKISKHPTGLLFHVSDKHGLHGILPNFEAGESWEDIHNRLHDAGDFGGREEHRHP